MHKTQPIRVGVFHSLGAADRAVSALLAAGFSRDAISIICPRPAEEHHHRQDIEHVKPAGARTPEAAAIGGAIGSVLGGLTALVGIAATGGTGLLIVGPLLGAAATGGLAGGFIGAMTTRGLEHEIANFYDQALRRGQTLVAVEETGTGPPLHVAEEVFARSGVVPIPLPEG